MNELSHGGGDFLFTIPFEEEWTRSLARIVLTGPEGRTELNDQSDQAMALVLDRETGRLREVLRGQDALRAVSVAAAEGPGRAARDTRVLISYGLPERPPN